MKRYNNIFKKICTSDNLFKAHRHARRDKTFYQDVQYVDTNPSCLNEIQEMLENKTYEVSEYSISVIQDKGKERELMKLPYFPDRIIQWAIMLQVEPIFKKVFCEHSCASIPKRGIHKASRLTEKYMKDRINTQYCLKLDVSKFYANVNHDILKKLLRKKFKDPDLLELFDKIIDSYPREKGIPIGSYLSQYFANFYLSYFDHWLKEEKKVKYVVRYMDDVVIFHNSKSYLHSLFAEIQEYLQNNLDLQVKSNYQIFPTAVRGVDFVGYRFFYGYKLLRKSTAKRFKRLMLRIAAKQEVTYKQWCAVNSYTGWLGWCDSWRLYDKYIKPIVPILVYFYAYKVKRKDPNKQYICRKYKRKLLRRRGRYLV